MTLSNVHECSGSCVGFQKSDGKKVFAGIQSCKSRGGMLPKADAMLITLITLNHENEFRSLKDETNAEWP
jgi:hypothetical protein